MNQLSLLDRPVEAHARWSDPETSHEAASSVEVTSGQTTVLRLMRSIIAPVTDEQLVRHIVQRGIPLSPSGARSRRAELVEKGLVAWNGTFQLLDSGRRARVWYVTVKGLAA